MLKIHILDEDIGKRLDVAITQRSAGEISRSLLQKLVKNSNVLINGTPLLDPSKKVTNSCKVEIFIEEASDLSSLPPPENIPLAVVYEDDHIIVINKQPGLVCHPAPGNPRGTLVNALMWRWGAENLSNCYEGFPRPGIVHRLDKDTSGLMIIAKTNTAHRKLAEYFAVEKGKSIIRRYKCIVYGLPKIKEGTIETFICRDPRDRQRYTVSDSSGKWAITKYRVLKSVYITSTKAVSSIECELLTGRTHQIRVHMRHIGTPLIGDPIYGKKKMLPKIAFPRTALHSFYLSLTHPVTNETLSLAIDFPPDMKNLINDLFG